MEQYIGIEIGDSAYTEFMMKDGEFKQTEDGVFLGRVTARNKQEALEKIKCLGWNKNRVFDEVIIEEICLR